MKIEEIPAVLWGKPSEKIYIYIHGKAGCGEESEILAQIACTQGWQVLGFDLPEHGQRKNERNTFLPWNIVPEIQAVYRYVQENWNRISIYANSLGAWFSMLSLAGKPIEKCLFVSPVLDMQKLIETMIGWAGVTPEQLEQEQEIITGFGETLSWNYYVYAKAHQMKRWDNPTVILYAGRDKLTDQQTVDHFVEKFHCGLTVMEDGEHWFHTQEQLNFLRRWIKDNVNVAEPGQKE